MTTLNIKKKWNLLLNKYLFLSNTVHAICTNLQYVIECNYFWKRKLIVFQLLGTHHSNKSVFNNYPENLCNQGQFNSIWASIKKSMLNNNFHMQSITT